MNQRAFGVLVALSVAGTVSLRAQDPRIQTRLPPQVVAQVQALVDSAALAGLPTEPLIQKALEGQSKGADGPRVVAAVRGLSIQLAAAREVLGSEARDQDIVAGAACLRAGATPEMLSELHQLRADQSLAVPLGVLSDLVALGVEVPRAWSAVRSVAASHGADAQYLALRDRVSRPGTAEPPAPNQPRLLPTDGAP